MRKALKQFAEFQDKILSSHDNIKKGEDGWSEERISFLYCKLLGEVHELAIEIMKYEAGDRNYATKLISRECADVANFAMMIYDNVNRKHKEA